MNLDLKRTLKWRLILISLSITLLSLALPIALLQVYDRILPNQSAGTAWVLALGVLIALMLEAGLRYGRAWMLNRSGMKFEAWSGVDVMRRLLTAPSKDLRKLGRHGMEESFTALKQYQDYYSGQALLALYDAPFIILFLWMIAYIGGWVVVIPLSVLVVAFITVFLLGKRAQYYAVESDLALEQRAPLMIEVFTRILPLKAAGMEGAMNRAFDQRHKELAEQQAGLDEYLMRIQMVTQFFSQGTTVLVVMFSAHSVINGDMSSGALAACTLLAGRSMAPVGALFSFWGQIQRSEVARQKAQSLLTLGGEAGDGSDELYSEPAALDKESDSSRLVGLRVENLKLPGETNLSGFEIKAGALARLPESGWLRWSPWFAALAGRPSSVSGKWRFLDSINTDSKRSDRKGAPNIALVRDSLTVFQGSVLENLTMFTPEREALAMDWSKRLGLHQRVTQLPQGYHTRLGQSFGSGVDRGMEQLIALVRAFACSPDILLLDHADRGLDLRSQATLAKQLSSLEGSLTCLVLTQSAPLIEVLSTISVATEGAQ